MNRLLPSAKVVRDQIDIYSPSNTGNRLSNVMVGSLTVKVFFENQDQGWDLLDGTNIQDSSISSGHVYFNQISGADGYYSIRFFPDRVGFWRVVFYHSATQTDIPLGYDVVPSGAFSSSGSGGLIANFG